MRMISVLVLICGSVLLLGCGDNSRELEPMPGAGSELERQSGPGEANQGAARVDGSSEGAFRASLDLVKADLPKDLGPEYEAALVLAEREAMEESFPGSLTMQRRFRAMLDGMTGKEVVTLGAELKAKADREERARDILDESSSLLIEGDFPAALAKAEAALEVAPDYKLAQAQVEQFRQFAADQAASESR